MSNSTALFQAIHQGDEDTTARLVREDPRLLESRSPSGLSPVLFAAYYQRPGIVRLLIEAGAPLTPHEAAAAGELNVVQQHLDRHPSQVNDFSEDGFQLLGLAAFFGHTSVVLDLLSRGATPATPSANNMQVTPLHSAAAAGYTDIARILLDAGANPNAIQAGGFTALMSAAQNGNTELTRLLLERGAERSARNDEGATALDLALEGNHGEVAQLLRE